MCDSLKNILPSNIFKTIFLKHYVSLK